MDLWIDLETYSTIPIDYGVYKYAEDAQILLISYALDDAPAKVVDVANGEPLPPELLSALNSPDVRLIAHNSNFDRTVLKKFYPAVADSARWIDTMIVAYSLSLPGRLSDLCELVKLPVDKAKDKDGRRLVLMFTKPRSDGSRFSKSTHPEDWERFVNYARLDVEAMRAVYYRLPHLHASNMWDEWRIDQRINDRGMCIDLELVHAAVSASARAKENSDLTVQRLTGGQVATVGQLDGLLKFIMKEYGYSLPDMQKSTLENRLNDDTLPAPARELISARLASAKASVKKFEALANCTCSDGRLRGCLQFMGAVRTGRFTGRLFQPQNLPRGTMSPAEVDTGIKALKSGIAEYLYDDVNALVSNCIRAAICAPSGSKLVVADLSNIEGRVLAWLAGEEWKLKAFRDFDAGRGVDLYKATYGRTFGVDPASVTKKQRQIGKVLELAMGYQGGVGAFVTFARGYGVDLDNLAEHIYSVMPQDTVDKATGIYEWREKKGLDFGDMSRHVWIACECVKQAWRAAHPAITGFWAAVDRATASIVNGEVQQATAGRVTFFRSGSYLVARLPSGRCMCYPAARIAKEGEVATFCYYGQLQASKRWDYIRTYSGKVVENCTQATARDVLTANMGAVEDNGYKIVLSVHDELITETPDRPEYNADRLADLMATVPQWADGLPLAAAGFESYRYKKD